MIEYVDISHAQELDAYVEKHPKCHFMQTSAWGKVKNYDDWTGIICRNDDDGSIRGVMAVLHSKINHTNFYRLFAQRGPIFDDGDYETFSQLIEASKQLAKRCNAIVIKIDPMIRETEESFMELTRKIGFTVNQATDFSLSSPRMSYVIDMKGLDKDSLMAQYHRSLRYHIRHSERNGIQLRMGTAEDLPVFYSMMEQTGGKNGFKPHSMKYYNSFLTKLDGMSALYIAEENGVPVAATMTAELGNRMWYMYGCSDRSNLGNHPNEFLQWKMQCHALDKGYEWFDLRGVEGYPVEDNPKYGLHRYKIGFGAEFYVYCGEFYLVTKPLAYKLVNTLKKITK